MGKISEPIEREDYKCSASLARPHTDLPWSAALLRPSGPPSQFTISLNFFMANTLTVFDAGLALNTHGSFVKGFTPLRAGVAGFFFNFTFNIPPSLKEPCFFPM